MKKVEGYEETQAFTGEFEKLTLGGHVCKIIGARVEKTSNDKDVLIVAFDIAEGDKKDYFKRRHEDAKRFNIDAKWPGVHRLFLENLEGKCDKFFKGFITSVEASNKGYKWDWEEKTLKDKLFGGVFGREQFEDRMNGQLKFATRLRFIRSTEKIKDVEIPEDKLLRNVSSNVTNTNGEYITIDDNSDLPF